MKNTGDQIGEVIEYLYKKKDAIIEVIEGFMIVIVIFGTLFLLLLKFCW